MTVFGIFMTALIVAFSGAMMPGPLLTVTIAESVRRGPLAILLIVGHAMLELALVVGFVFGLQYYLKNHFVISAIGLAGGAVLLWMGYGTLTGGLKGQISLASQAVTKRESKFGPVVEGIVISLSNPYWTLWWATIGAKFIVDSLKYKALGMTSFYFGHILADFIWYGVVIGAIVSGRRFISDRVYQGVLAFCGVFLIGLGGWFIVSVFRGT
jgi:threonine/homoserine/homoserine lactone efflux protein